MRNRGKGDDRFIFKGTILGLQPTRPRGDGVTPTITINEAGGVHRIMGDIEVPAVTSGNFADWHDSYPGQYVAPGQTELDLVRYMTALDTGQNLHGKGNLHVLSFHLYIGTGVTGASPPTQGGGTIAVSVKRNGLAGNLWAYAAGMPSTAGVVPATSVVSAGYLLGSDLGTERLVMTIEAVGANIAAGRWRFALLVAEI